MESLALCTALIHPIVPTLYRPPPVVKKDNDNVAITVSSMDSTDYSQLNTSLFRTNGATTGLQSGGGDAKTFAMSTGDLDDSRTSLSPGVQQVGTKSTQGGQGDAEAGVVTFTVVDNDSADNEEQDATPDEKSGVQVVQVTEKLVGVENTSRNKTCEVEMEGLVAVEQTISKVS